MSKNRTKQIRRNHTQHGAASFSQIQNQTGTTVHINRLNDYERVPLEGYSNQLPDKN
jgi:hypothetical protein